MWLPVYEAEPDDAAAAEAEMDAAWDIGRAWAVRDFEGACAAFTEWMADRY